MLNIYKAIDIIDVISENSGRTKPWVVLAQTPQGVKPFVVKLFTSQQVDFANSITHEVIGNALAMEFELCVPEMALIDIPEDLAMNKAPHYQIQFSNTDPRLKFATARIPNANTLIKDLPKSFYNKRIEMDTLYAFDNLIRNADRGQNKTNMLVSGNLLHLIDHEMALKQNDISGIDMNEFEIDEKFTKYHLFYSYLKRAIKNTKSQKKKWNKRLQEECHTLQ